MTNILLTDRRSKDNNRLKGTSQPQLSTARYRQIFYLPIGLKKMMLVGLAIATFGWIFLFSPWFRVSKVEIIGQVSPETVNIINQFYGKNIFLLADREGERTLVEQEPSLKHLKIVRGLPNMIRVQVMERTAIANWRSGESWYKVDGDGVAFKIDLEPSQLKIVDDQNVPIKIGQPIAGREFFDFALAVARTLPTVVDLQYQQGHVAETTFNLKVKTDRGIEILFDTTTPLDRQMDALARIWNQKRDEVKQYIDVRVEGYVYYQ